MTQPEVWLRGPLPGYIDELQPVAHSLLQVREELARARSLAADRLWTRPGEAASIGDPNMASEDVSYFLQRAPGCYFNIGAANPVPGGPNP